MSLTFHQAQREIALDPHRFRVVCCGRRFGKTTLAIDQMKGRATLPNSRVAYIAPTFQQARDIAWNELKNDCKDAAESINESRLEVRLVNGSLIILRGWEAIETLRGQKFDLVVLDEVAMMRNFWLMWQEVVRPTLTDNKGEGLFISTPKGFNHFYDLFNMQEKDPDFKSFHFSSYDNPHLPKEEIDKARQELTENRFGQEYLADFRKMEGLVYKEFDRQIHVIDPKSIDDKNFAEIYVGVDYGFTNPAAVLTIKRDGSDCYYITDESYKRGQTDPQTNEYVAAIPAHKVYPDPEAASAVEELKKKIRTVREVVKGKDSVKNGIDKVRELFKAKKLFVCSNCVSTIEELETYSYPDKKPDRNEYEDPIKENDHAMDAMRYVIMMTYLSAVNQSAHVHYSQSSLPRNNLNPLANTPKGSDGPNPQKIAHTFVPRL